MRMSKFDEFNDLETRYEVILEFRGEPVMDYQLAMILRLIDKKGSLLAASRSLGIPYSRAWDKISRAERVMGAKLVIAQRGARKGGMRLTNVAKKLLKKYLEAERRLKLVISPIRAVKRREKEPDIIIAHSHDPILALVLEKLKDKYEVENACVGSGMALAMLSLEEVDVACSHLYDPGTKEYNKPYFRFYWLNERVKIIGGYSRELVFAFNPNIKPMSIDDVIKKLLAGNLRLVNRNLGSGTRVFLDGLLRADKKDISNISGYNNIAYTHLEAARIVAAGKADVGLMLRYAAEMYGLRSVHVTWERFEYIALRSSLKKAGVKGLEKLLSSDWLNNLLSNTPGYRAITR